MAWSVWFVPLDVARPIRCFQPPGRFSATPALTKPYDHRLNPTEDPMKSVLIVDDDTFMRRLLLQTLKSTGRRSGRPAAAIRR